MGQWRSGAAVAKVGAGAAIVAGAAASGTIKGFMLLLMFWMRE
jgi:hypothetical protein